MATINLQCKSLSQIHSNAYNQAENNMTGKAYMKEALKQVCLKSITKRVSYVFDKQLNVCIKGV